MIIGKSSKNVCVNAQVFVQGCIIGGGGTMGCEM